MVEDDYIPSSISKKAVSDYNEKEKNVEVGYVSTETVKQIETNCVEAGQVFREFEDIAEYLLENQDIITKTATEETGYTISDSKELLNASIEFLKDIETQYNRVFDDGFKLGPEKSGTGNTIRTRIRPKGNILIITPGNATLPLAVILSASALVTGNTVTLKPSSKVARTAHKVMKPFTDKFGDRFNIVFADSAEITTPEVLESFDAVHYTGSSRYYESVKTAADVAKIDSYIEGEGNGVFIVDDRPKEAAEALVNALTRCNGMLCTTPSGVMVREEIHDKFVKALRNQIEQVEIGSVYDSETELSKEVNPNFDAEVLEGFEELKPVILSPEEGIDRRELYGPGAWLDKWSSKEELEDFLASRNHGLNLTVFTDREDFFQHSKAMASRYCFNVDPTLQSPFEPWGALGVSGDSPGNTFMEKFSRETVEIRGE